jgi:hypothetical protein
MRWLGMTARLADTRIRRFDERRGESNCESFVEIALEIFSATNNE